MVGLKRLMLVLTLFTAVNAYAEDAAKDKPHFEHKGGFFEIKEKLNLTDEQKEKVKELKKEGGMFGKQNEVWEEKDKLRDLIKKDDASESEIYAQVEKINKMQSEANTARVKHILAFKKILTKEQFTTLSDHMEEKRAAFRENMKERFKGKFGEKTP